MTSASLTDFAFSRCLAPRFRNARVFGAADACPNIPKLRALVVPPPDDANRTLPTDGSLRRERFAGMPIILESGEILKNNMSARFAIHNGTSTSPREEILIRNSKTTHIIPGDLRTIKE